MFRRYTVGNAHFICIDDEGILQNQEWKDGPSYSWFSIIGVHVALYLLVTLLVINGLLSSAVPDQSLYHRYLRPVVARLWAVINVSWLVIIFFYQPLHRIS